MLKHFALIIGSALILTACASSNSTQSAIKNAPKVAGSWQNLGSISNGNIIVSYDASSLKKNKELVQMRDRKIVVNPNEERYIDTLRYKVAVSDWEFNCRNRSYRLTAVQFLDERGKIVSQENYAKNPIPPMPISAGTIAEKQFNVACR